MKLRIVLIVLALAATACEVPGVGSLSATETPTLPPIPDTPTSAAPPVATIPSPAIVELHMLDASDGWALTETNVLRTTDGGDTWYDLTMPGATEVGYTVSSFFLDVNHAWVLAPDSANFFNAGTLYRTEDGGLHWAASSVPFGGGRLVFLDASHGWMMANLGVATGSMGVAVFQTGDGGATWNQAYINDPTVAGAGDSLPLGGLKDGLTPLNAQIAWIGGITYAPGVIYLYQTEDGGHTWAQQPVQIPGGSEQAEFETSGPIFVSPSDAYLPVHVAAEISQLAIYVSHDGGASWSLTPALIPNGGEVDFVSATDGFVWNGSQFYVTHDGAQTWTIIPPDVVFGDTFASMDFVDSSTGWVVTYDVSGQRGLYQTTDGGATWNPLLP